MVRSAVDANVLAEQLRVIYRQAVPASLISLLISIVVCLILRDVTDRAYLAAWFGALTAIAIFRFVRPPLPSSKVHCSIGVSSHDALVSTLDMLMARGCGDVPGQRAAATASARPPSLALRHAQGGQSPSKDADRMRSEGDRRMTRLLMLAVSLLVPGIVLAQTPAPPPTPADVKPGSITCEDVPYPHAVSYLPMTLYGQDIRMAYMDVPAQGQANGKTVVLFHGMNFAGFYWGGPIDALRKEGFRVVVPDQIGFGRSSKPIIPYNFHDMARNTRLLLQHLKIDKAFIVGHSMGGMLAARFATQHPDVAERVVIYNPIGLLDPRYERPWGSIDEAYKRNLGTTYQQIYAGIVRYFSHNPAAWKPEFEKYPKIRYAWTLSADWPRYAMVQALLGQMTYLDPVVHDWAHIKAPTLAFGGAEDSLAGPASVFQARMKFIADTIPNGNGRLHLIPGLGHVPHFEAPEKTYPPLIAFLREGIK